MIRFKQKNLVFQIPNKSVNYVWQQVSSGPPDADATAFVTAAGITDSIISSAIDTLVKDLKFYSIWTKMKAIYPFVGGTAATHKFNLKDPRDLDAAFRLTFFGGWTHSATGSLPNGTNGYADTFFKPSLNLSSTNGHHGFYHRTNLNINLQSAYGCEGGGGRMVFFPYAFSAGWISDLYDNNVSRIVSNVGPSTGFVLGTRASNNSHKLFRNGVELASNTSTTSGVPPSGNYLIGQFQGFYSANELSLASIGDGLTDTEAANFYTAVQTFQTALGRNV